MKQKFKRFRESGLFMFVVFLLCSILGVCDASAMTADVIKPVDGGAIQTDSTTSVTDTRENSPNLILDEIDDKVTKIRPMLNPLDTISRYCDTVSISNQKYRHYAIDVLDASAKLPTAYSGGGTQFAFNTDNNGIFSADETILVPEADGYKDDQTTVDDAPLMLYIIGKDTNGYLICKPVNGKLNGTTKDSIPNIPANATFLRMGKAGSESQISSSAYSGVPTDWEQYAQKFMCQVEETTLFKLADKEVDWTFTDQAEEAIFDMKRGMNRSFWRGIKGMKKWTNSKTDKAEDIYFTKGIWYQAGKEFNFGSIAPDTTSIVAFMKTVFTGNASSKEKVFIAGSNVIEAFETVEFTRNVQVGAKKQAYGLEFNSIISKFGTLWVIHDESFDDMGFANEGFVLDPNYLRKGSYGLRTEDFDLRKAGISDKDARALIEIAFLVLKNPKSHTRVKLS